MHRGWRGFGFGFGPRGFAWSGGGPRRRQWFEAGDMKYVILKLLRDKPRHGYEVMKELEERMHGCYSRDPMRFECGSSPRSALRSTSRCAATR